jgi:hypothetical protein
MAREGTRRRDKVTVALDDDLLDTVEDAAGLERLTPAAVIRRAVALWANDWRSQHSAAA